MNLPRGGTTYLGIDFRSEQAEGSPRAGNAHGNRWQVERCWTMAWQKKPHPDSRTLR